MAPADGILSGPIDLDPGPRKPVFPPVPANPETVFFHRDAGVSGRVMGMTTTEVILRDRRGRDHRFTRAAGAFALEDGTPITLVSPTNRPRVAAPRRTASGAVAVTERARVARGSRIWVEGIHDAELVEKVWGDELRAEGVVVEPLHGADDLAGAVAEFGPRPDQRLGVLLDHITGAGGAVPGGAGGTKEERIARTVQDPNVLIVGHPFVDVWQAIRPTTAGIASWPEIPPGQPWKEGVCAALGWSGSVRECWVRLLGRVSTYRDLEPALLGPVEQLIDFVAPPPQE